MSENWITAAQQYAKANPQPMSAAQVRACVEVMEASFHFHRSAEGAAAALLLHASEKIIVLTEPVAEDMDVVKIRVSSRSRRQTDQTAIPQHVVYAWGPMGPTKVVHNPLIGMSLPMPSVPIEFGIAIAKSGRTKEEVFSYIRSELEKIAATAPTSD